MISNWKNFRTPYEPLQHFTRSEPFPADDKATAIDPRKKKGMRKVHPGRAHRALEDRRL